MLQSVSVLGFSIQGYPPLRSHLTCSFNAGGPVCCSMLNFFQLEYFLFSVGVLNGGGILQLGEDQGVNGSLLYL